MKYKKVLRDEIGNSHPRKNLYLKDLVEASPQEAKKIKANKNSHPYIVSYKKYKDEEKVFLDQLNKEKDKEFQGKNSKIEKYQKDLFIAEKKSEFYKDYIDLDYDAQLNYKVSTHKIRHLPEIINHYQTLDSLLAEKERDLANLDKSLLSKKEEEISKYNASRKEDLNREIEEIKEKKKERLNFTKGLQQRS